MSANKPVRTGRFGHPEGPQVTIHPVSVGEDGTVTPDEDGGVHVRGLHPSDKQWTHSVRLSYIVLDPLPKPSDALTDEVCVRLYDATHPRATSVLRDAGKIPVMRDRLARLLDAGLITLTDAALGETGGAA